MSFNRLILLVAILLPLLFLLRFKSSLNSSARLGALIRLETARALHVQFSSEFTAQLHVQCGIPALSERG